MTIINSIDVNEWIKNKLRHNEERYLHSLGAQEAAKKLAAEFGADVEKASIAALIHDNAKCYKYEELLKVIEENNFPVEEVIKNNRKVVHAFVGACLAQKELGIQDEDIINAIMYHTTGRINMSLLEKVVYLADKIEMKTRPPEQINKITNVLEETKNMDKAMLISFDMTIKSLIDRKLSISIKTIEIWNDLITKS